MIDNLTALAARDDLLWIVSEWPKLLGRLRPGGGNALNGMPSGNSHPLPIDTHISDLMFEIEECVARHYGHILMDETEWTPTTSSMPGLLRDVAMRYGHFTAGNDDRQGLGFCDDATYYRDKVHHALERPAPPTYVGPCQHRGEDGAGCSGELYVREGRTEGKCRECGTPFTLSEQREFLMGELEVRLMTASEIASALVVLDHKVPIGTIKSWIHRKRLPESTPDSGLYRLADARELATRAGR